MFQIFLPRYTLGTNAEPPQRRSAWGCIVCVVKFYSANHARPYKQFIMIRVPRGRATLLPAFVGVLIAIKRWQLENFITRLQETDLRHKLRIV